MTCTEEGWHICPDATPETGSVNHHISKLTSASVVEELVDSRAAVYGDPAACFERVAEVWTALLNHPVQPWQVPLLMMGLKLIRVAETPDYSDNSDDIEGYLDIFRTIIGPDMVKARSVSEYLEKRGSND